MVKVFSAVILLFLLIPIDLSFAQSQEDWSSKIYSGYLHHYSDKDHVSFWHSLFGKRPSKQKEDLQDRQCSIEFKSPVSFTHQSVSEVPEELSYFVKFKNDLPSAKADPIEENAFKKFIIKIYTNDDQEYSIDPDEEGKQVRINDEHHIYDAYLIYLILGHDIDHLEIVSSSGDDKDKYVLDKLEIQNDD